MIDYPRVLVKTTPQGYIVNTDPHDRPGQHWLAVWTDGNVCEVLDSYALPIGNVRASHPVTRLDRETLEVCGDQWQVPASHLKQECGDYALLYLKAKARGRTLQDFLNEFSDHGLCKQ